MTEEESRGLDIVRQLLHRELDAGNGPEDEQGVKDLQAALEWVRRQQTIGRARRQRRGKYLRRR